MAIKASVRSINLMSKVNRIITFAILGHIQNSLVRGESGVLLNIYATHDI